MTWYGMRVFHVTVTVKCKNVEEEAEQTLMRHVVQVVFQGLMAYSVILTQHKLSEGEGSQ